MRTGRPPAAADVMTSYGIRVGAYHPHPFGFESECWVADDRWFVKVWRHGPPANLALLDRLDLPVAAPVRTRDGALTAQSDGRTYALFPYVAGRAATWDDWAEIARTMRMIHAHPTENLELPPATFDERDALTLRERLDHPWIRDRRVEVVAMIERLEAVVERARLVERPRVLCHSDLIGDNLLIGEDGRLVAVLDWDWARLAPPEHDVWIATEGPHTRAFMSAYGAVDLDRTHLEYALLRRAVGDLAARVAEEIDRPGIDTWGFARWRRLDENLALLLGNCRG